MKLEIKNKEDGTRVVYANELYEVVIQHIEEVGQEGYCVRNHLTGVDEMLTASLPEAIANAEQAAAFVDEDMHKRYRTGRVAAAQLGGAMLAN